MGLGRNALAEGQEAFFIKIHPDAMIPTYGTELSACCDLSLPENHYIWPSYTNIYPTGLIAIPPQGWHWQIYLRSSTPTKYPGLILANHVGIVDSDYCGLEDELKLILSNIGERELFIPQHVRIAQMRLVPNARPEIRELSYEEAKLGRSRGGFGSTG
jgi:dUTP pyrophosphatase